MSANVGRKKFETVGRRSVKCWIVVLLLGGAMSIASDEQEQQEQRSRKVFFEGVAFELTPVPDQLAVRFVEAVKEDQKEKLLGDEPSITRATLIQSLGHPRMDIFRVEAPDTHRLFREAHRLAKSERIEFATPVFRSGEQELIPTGELFVEFKANAADGARNAIEAEFKLTLAVKTTWREKNYLLRTTADTAVDVFSVCEEVLKRKDIEYCQPNFIRKLKRLTAPNDLLYPSQWSLHNIGQTGGIEDCDADAPEGWCISRGCDVIIAIIDDGMDMTHPDYVNKLVPGRDFTTAPPTACPPGCQPLAPDGHGTACAGIAAAESNNGQGVAGVNWYAGLMPIRIAHDDGMGGWITNDQWLSDGIAWAYQNGADVLSNSWSYPPGAPPSAQVHAAIQDAVTLGRGGLGSVVVFAAGNDDLSPPNYPCLHPESFCVAATSPCDERKNPGSCDGENWGSNFGPGLNVAAPGVLMPTTDIQGAGGYGPGDYILDFNGTSAATPFVAGVVSLVMCKFPHYTGRQIEIRVEQTCDKVGGYAYDSVTGISNDLGHGRVNIYRALTGKPQVVLGPLPAFPSVYSDYSDHGPPYQTTHHNSAACEWLGEEYSPEKSDMDTDDPDGKPNVGPGADDDNQDAFDDGVRFFPPYIPGEIGLVGVTVSVGDSTHPRYQKDSLFLNMWFDWEADDDFNNTHDWVLQNEIIDPSTWGAGVNSQTFVYSFIVPSNAVNWHLQNDQPSKFMNVRTRLTYEQSLSDAYMVADYGEVEDDRFLNFVEMFDVGPGYMTVDTSLGCDGWEWIDNTNPNTCHPPFVPDGPPLNGYMAAEVYISPPGPGHDSAMRTPSFDLTELTRAELRFQHSSVEAITGEVRLLKTGVLDAILAQYPLVMCLGCDPNAPCVIDEVIDLTPWCDDGNDDIVIEFKTLPQGGACDPFAYQDWKVDNVVVWGVDDIVPGPAKLETTQLSPWTNELEWTTPGDDGMIRQAETYNIRYGPEPIDGSNWLHSLWVRPDMAASLPIPQAPGVAETLVVQRLAEGFHHFGLRTMDEVTFISGIGGSNPQPYCGNGVLDPGEQCDPGDPGAGIPADDAACPGLCIPAGIAGECMCAPPTCGDGVVDPGEDCDPPGNTMHCPGGRVCQANCACPAPFCGDNILDPGEVCDGTDDAACPGQCQPNCTCPTAFCGDGVLDPGEQCDPGDPGAGIPPDDAACPGRCRPNCACPPDPVLPDPNGPAGGLACDDTGGNYGLPCQTCSGGGRDGLPCIVNADCPGGGTCTANHALCAGGSCNMQLAHPKNRFIGFIAPASTTGQNTAIRLRLVSIDNNPICSGAIRWAAPPQSFNEGGPGSPTFLASALEVGAAPSSWRDWSADGLVFLYGQEIIPGSTYEVQIVDQSCQANLGDPNCYSNALVVHTAKWGDVVALTFPFTGAAQPDVSDISALVAKFGGAPTAVSKTRAKLVPHVMNPALQVDVIDISACVSAFQGSPYPNTVTNCP